MIESGHRDSYRFVIAGLTISAHFAGGLSFAALSPIMPLVTEDYGISHTMGGLLLGVVMLSVGIFSLPAGIIVARVGLWRTYTVSWLMMGLLTLTALSPGFEGLLLLRMLFGLGVAALTPATAILVMQWFRPRELSVINGVNFASISLGMVVSVSTVAPLSSVLGWERVMGLFGAVALAGAFAWMLWGKVRDSGSGQPVPLNMDDVWAVLRDRTILLLALADTAGFSLYIVLIGWLPTFYSETRDLSLNQAGYLISFLPFTGIFAVLLGGFLPLKIGSRRLFLIVPGAMACVGGLGSFLIDSTLVAYISVALLGVGCSLYIPTLITWPMELPGMTPEKVAVAWGWMMTVSSIGAFVAPLVVGAVRDSTGTFIPGFLILGILAWFLPISGFLLPKGGAPQRGRTGPAASPASAED